MLNFDYKKSKIGRKRPDFLIPKYHLIEKLKDIIENAPDKLKVQANNKIIDDDQIKKFLGILL